MTLPPIFLLVPAALIPSTVLAGPATNPPKPPSFVLMLADDLGYGDLGITGSKQIRTPHIDPLAANGVRFTNAYVSSSVCAPLRAGLMTGKHQASFGFRDNLAPAQPGHDPEQQIDHTQSMLRELGRWEVRSPNPVFHEPADWRVRHLSF